MSNSSEPNSRRSSSTSTSTSTTSYDSRNTQSHVPPIQGSFSNPRNNTHYNDDNNNNNNNNSNNNSNSNNNNNNNNNSFTLHSTQAGWEKEEPYCDASPYNETTSHLFTFSPAMTDVRVRTSSVDTVPRNNSHNHGTTNMNMNMNMNMNINSTAKQQEVFVDLDIEQVDGLIRSDHGSVKSSRTTRDGIMRQVENSLFTAREMKLRRASVWCITIAFLSLIIGLSVGLSNSTHHHHQQQQSNNASPTSTLPTTIDNTLVVDTPTSCDFTNNPKPDPFLQCECFNTISKFDANVLENYHDLKNSWLATLLPHFDEKLDSCHPHNIALTWLSADITVNAVTKEIDYRDRFLLVAFFAQWKGKNWKNKGGWLSGNTICEWFGIECDAQNTLVGLKLNENNLMGLVPSELSLLTSLGKF